MSRFVQEEVSPLRNRWTAQEKDRKGPKGRIERGPTEGYKGAQGKDRKGPRRNSRFLTFHSKWVKGLNVHTHYWLSHFVKFSSEKLMLQKQLFPSRVFLFFLITFKLENVRTQEGGVPLYESNLLKWKGGRQCFYWARTNTYFLTYLSLTEFEVCSINCVFQVDKTRFQYGSRKRGF